MIYKKSRHFQSIFSLSFFLFIFGHLNQVFALSHETVKQYAPRVYLHVEEAYKPSNVEFFFQHVHSVADSEGYYTTILPLESASSVLPFFNGQSVLQNTVPVYAMVVPKPRAGDDITDVIYYTFYPYNRGKRVCIGVYSSWTGCIGGYSTFGNHVGDWESVLVRFKGERPALVRLSSHGSGRIFDWGSAEIKKMGTHPIVYSAWGSHGLYENPGRFTYMNLPGGDSLYDDTSEGGEAWDTWNNVVIISHYQPGQYPQELNWMNFSGRWGNKKMTCTIEFAAGECVLNNGPIGPAFKSFANINADTNDI